jgi:dephospho-CoA kinase
VKPRRFVVGLTGGIGAGKSTALAEFERRGASTVSLDAIAREQARPGREGYRAIVRSFGRGVLDASGRIDRRELGSRVFRDAAARRKLERAVHPPILREMKSLVSRLEGVVVVDVPLLFEGGYQKLFDATVLVDCPQSQRIHRVVRRDKVAPAEVRRRIKAQLPVRVKRRLADLTLDNDGTPAALRAKVRAVQAGLSLLYGGTPNGNAD